MPECPHAAPPISRPIERPDPRRPIFELFPADPLATRHPTRTIALGDALCDLRPRAPTPSVRAAVIGRWRWREQQ
jgi:hypothetical protein